MFYHSCWLYDHEVLYKLHADPRDLLTKLSRILYVTLHLLILQTNQNKKKKQKQNQDKH